MPKVRWEYQSKTLYHGMDIEMGLAELGAAGWEVVSVEYDVPVEFGVMTRANTYLLKRQLDTHPELFVGEGGKHLP